MKCPPKERFERKYIPITECGCWLWLDSLSNKGYGEFHLYGERVLAHRASWLFTYGYLPNDLDVLHKCDMPSCVNPNHLFLGTHLDNMQDKARKGRVKIMWGEKNGFHKLTEAQVIEIRNSALPSIFFARKFGLDNSTICLARKGITWKYL